MAKRKTRLPGGGFASDGTATVNPQGKGRGANVGFTRNELNALLPIYFTVRDCIEGEPAIKGIVPTGSNNGALSFGTDWTGNDIFTGVVLSRARRYLPMPNPHDQSAENLARYSSYVQRAVFYNVTARTLGGMVGQVFLRPPILTSVPKQLDPMLEDMDGFGTNHLQFAKRVAKDTLAYGRAGILVDFPRTDGKITSRADIVSGAIKPTIIVYYPWDIINWATKTINGKKYLTLVVLRETISEEGDDGFELIPTEQYRVLRFDPQAGHTVEIYRQSSGTSVWANTDTFQPLDGLGKPLQGIPFTFVGSESNDEVPNKSPMYDMASLNIAHYRNSADHEESCFQVGQPTPVAEGLTEDWVKNVLKDEIRLGSRSCIPLPVNGKLSLLQANPNTMPGQAMKDKEAQMVALGAKLVEKMSVQRTATETIIETTSETSVLGNVAINAGAALTWALRTAAQFINVDGSKLKYELNTDYELTKMSPQDRDSIIASWVQGATTFSEMRQALRTGGIANDTAADDDATLQKIIKERKELLDAGVLPTSVGKNPKATQQSGRPGANPADQPGSDISA